MIFLDNNATTAIEEEVVQAMKIDLDGIPRNPSSTTKYGREGKFLLIKARKEIAQYFHVDTKEVYFTSGGTESNVTMIHGFYHRSPGPIISSPTEHLSILETIKKYPVRFLSIDENGVPILNEEIFACRPSCVVLSYVNNETGVTIPLQKFASLCSKHSIPLLLDGVAALGKIPCPLPQGIAAISFSGHKIHGPKGIGLLIIRHEYIIPPLLYGGHQEYNMRAGTENLSGILGMAKAISLIRCETFAHIAAMRDTFESLLIKRLPTCMINGKKYRVSNVSNISFLGCDAEILLVKLEQRGVIASTGSACAAGSQQISHVLLHMGLPMERIHSSIRFSFSHLTTHKEIIQAADIVISCVNENNATLTSIQHI